MMFEAQTEHGLGAPATPFVLGYQRLVEDLEQALWEDGVGNISDAYEEYRNAYTEALSDPMIYQRVASALQRLTNALAHALERADTRTLVEESVARYLDGVGTAWSELRGDGRDLESLLAVATGMTTIAWLQGLGASGLVGPFGAIDILDPSAAQSWSSPTTGPDPYSGSDGGGAWDSSGLTPGIGSDAGAADSADEDGIVWQELAVGDDGSIVQRAVAPGRGSAERASRVERSESEPVVSRAPRGAAKGAEPVELVDHAYAAYVEGLRAAGLPVASPDDADPGPSPETGATTARSELERRSTELTAAYLRLAQGVGSIPDLFLSYARFLGSAGELVEQELALVRAYERLMTAGLQRSQPAGLRQAADAHYRRFLAAVRDVWMRVDPATLQPEQLSELAAITARAAAVNERATTGLWPSAG